MGWQVDSNCQWQAEILAFAMLLAEDFPCEELVNARGGAFLNAGAQPVAVTGQSSHLPNSANPADASLGIQDS